MSKSNDNRTKEQNETVVLHIIDKMIQKGKNKELINKIASSAVINHLEKGKLQN